MSNRKPDETKNNSARPEKSAHETDVRRVSEEEKARKLSEDEKLNEEIEESFPASDPPSHTGTTI